MSRLWKGQQLLCWEGEESPPGPQGCVWGLCVVPGRQGSAQGRAAVGEDVAVAVGVVVVLPSFGRPRAFNLRRDEERRGQRKRTHLAGFSGNKSFMLKVSDVRRRKKELKMCGEKKV